MNNDPMQRPGPQAGFVGNKINSIVRSGSGASNSGRPKETIDQKKNGMFSGIVRRKDPVKHYGKFDQLKFFVMMHDTFKTYNCMFDSVHKDAFDVGDTIHFSAVKSTEENQDGWFKIQKKHEIYNETRKNGGITKMEMRPTEEIKKLYEKTIKSYDEVCNIINQDFYKARSEETKILKYEKYNLELLIAYLHFVQFNIQHPDHRFDMNNFKSCTISVRHFGEGGWNLERIFEQVKHRLTTVQKEIQNYQNSEEYLYLNMLHIALAWTFDQVKDAQIGMNFSWRMFSRSIKDDFQLRGKDRDEWNTEERRPLVETAARVLTELDNKKREEKLNKQFTFLKGKKK